MSSPLRPDGDAAPFIHPADQLDAPPLAEALSSLADKRGAAEIFVRLFADCIPIGTPYKGGRKWKAGYNRMVAVAYVVAPELFGSMTQERVAGELGIHVVAFRRLLREVEAQLAMRAQTARARRLRHPVAPRA